MVYFLSLFENDRNIPVSFGYFFHCESYALISAKNGLGYILGDFFTNSSGHPARKRQN
jgi:hypothetical protein